MDLREISSGVDEGRHWYFQTKKLPLLRYFRECAMLHGVLDVVDIGAGSGFFSRELERQCASSVGRLLLVDTAYSPQETSQAGSPKLMRATHLPDVIEESFLLVMDVLEHLDDDRAFLADLRGRLRGDNFFFLTVPAFDSLWSGHDEYLGHRRRYTKGKVSAVLRETGFEVTRAYYLYASIFPVVYAARSLKGGEVSSDLTPARPWLDRFLTHILSLEMSLSRRNGLFGVTCVAEGVVRGPDRPALD